MVVQLIHVLKAFGTSVTEVIVPAAIGSISSSERRKPSLSAPA